MRLLTVHQLVEKRACEGQVLLFRRLFGNQVMVTEELCIKHASDFDWEWADFKLLSRTAQAAYYQAIAPAKAAYGQAIASAKAAYDQAIAPAKAAYDQAIASAKAAYCQACASAWAKAYIGD